MSSVGSRTLLPMDYIALAGAKIRNTTERNVNTNEQETTKASSRH